VLVDNYPRPLFIPDNDNDNFSQPDIYIDYYDEAEDNSRKYMPAILSENDKRSDDNNTSAIDCIRPLEARFDQALRNIHGNIRPLRLLDPQLDATATPLK
jgi:hypothetical protein